MAEKEKEKSAAMTRINRTNGPSVSMDFWTPAQGDPSSSDK
jgi:hypothetical protein